MTEAMSWPADFSIISSGDCFRRGDREGTGDSSLSPVSLRTVPRLPVVSPWEETFHREISQTHSLYTPQISDIHQTFRCWRNHIRFLQ